MRSPRCTPATLCSRVRRSWGELSPARMARSRVRSISTGRRELTSVTNSTRALFSPTSAMRPARPSPVTTAWPERDAGLAPDIEQRAAHIGADAVADDAGGDEGGLGPLAEIGEAAQALVLVLQPPRGGLPGQQPGILLAQAGVLLAQGGEFLEIGDGAVGDGDRPGDGLEHRAGEVERQHAGMLDQDGVGLADQHGAERRRSRAGRGRSAARPCAPGSRLPRSRPGSPCPAHSTPKRAAACGRD